ncbi:MAG: hypothetical protein JXL97_08490 [Bacteroidales bacterium]|nr:hypothetical protein [Bacteroidales bacterium]
MNTKESKILKYEYILYYENYSFENINTINALCEELTTLGFNCSTDTLVSDLIKVYSNGSEFEIYFEKFENFQNTLHIKSSSEQTPYYGFLQTLWRIMNMKFSVEYSRMECIEYNRFKLINDRFPLRFISKNILYSLLNKPIRKVDINIFPFEGNEFEIRKGNIFKEEIKYLEEGWISFSKALDYDDWDIVSSDFLPITISEYMTETNKFIKFWGIDENSMNLEKEKDIISILQVKSEWDFIEYLINRSNSLEYISLFNYTD